MDIVFTIVLALLCFSISLLTVRFIMRNAFSFGLVDKPNERSSHKNITPSLGGLGILFALFVSLPILYYINTDLVMLSIILMGLFLGGLGLVDDLKDIDAKLRLFFQVLSGVVLCVLDLRLESFYGFLGLHEIPLLFQWIFTIFITATVINAFNLIDGIDGLASGLGIISTVIYLFLFVSLGEYNFAYLGIVVLTSLLAFFVYNVYPAKIFLGDTGSLVIGFMMVCFFFKSLQIETLNSNFDLLLPLCPLIIPVFDLIRVSVFRILKKKSPIKADRSHLHHLLLKLGLNHLTASIVMYGACGLLVLVSFNLKDYSLTKSFLLIFLFCAILTEVLTVARWQGFDKKMKQLKESLFGLRNSNSKLVPQYEMKDKRIMIIEDDPFYSDVISLSLDEVGYKTLSYRSIEDVALTKGVEVDAVLVDNNLGENNMKGVDGISLLKEKFNEVPVLVVSGQNDLQTAVNTINKGASDYVVKDDFMATMLLSALNRLFSSDTLTRQLFECKNRINIERQRMLVFIIALILVSNLFV